MGQKGGWFSAVKRALSPSNSKEKKDKRSHNHNSKQSKLWFGKHKTLHRDSTRIEVPCTPPTEEAKLTEAENEQSKHAYSVAYATAVAAEAAVAAAHAAAEVVRLTSIRFSGKSREEIAAIRIQTAYRGHLARRALRAVRGLGRLKSLIQGQSVKRQATSTLRCMQTLARVQSQVRSRRIRMLEENQAFQRQLLLKHEKDLNNMRSPLGNAWDDSQKSKEEIEAGLQSKQEAAVRRERAMAYAHSHRQAWKNSTNSVNTTFLDPSNPQWGWSWLERWMAARPWETQSITDKEPSVMDTGKRGRSSGGRVRPESQKGSVDDDSRSFYSVQSDRNRRNSIASSVRDDESLDSSPVVPSYMGSTKSAKARSRAASPSLLGSGRKGASEMGSVAGSAKKRLSFSGSPARIVKRFPESPMADLRS